MLASLTMASATVTTPDPATFSRARLLIRGGVARVTDRTGNLVWTAHLSDMRKTARNTWELDLVDGGTVTAVSQGCGCHG